MSTSAAPGTIVQLIQLTRSVYRRLTEDVLGMKLKPYLTLTQLREGPGSQSDLCATMHMDPNNCELMLNALEDAGYAQRRRDPADLRRHIVEITPAGLKAMAS